MSFYVEPPTVEVVPVPDLHVRMLGPFTVQVHGTPLPALHSRKGSWLLALLVLKHAQSLDRNYLAATLWPDSDHSESLKNLRNTLSNLRCAMWATATLLPSITVTTHTAPRSLKCRSGSSCLRPDGEAGQPRLPCCCGCAVSGPFIGGV